MAGQVTFVFTDVEGSTRLLQQLGTERYAGELLEHRRCVREAVAEHRGVEVGTEGDAFFVVFDDAADALSAVGAAQAALSGGRIRIRVGVHTGEPLFLNGDYFGLDVHKAARICSAAHGGQVLVSAATAALVGLPLRDLGRHRLKDLTAPERLFQFGDGDFPPPRALQQTNLPIQPAPLVGRTAELAELVDLARAHRLLTLTGPGGAGKTRLALELVAQLSDDVDGAVWWVPLAAVRDPELVVPAIAAVVGAKGDVAGHLEGRPAVILLDNLEQVLEAAPRISELLGAAPDLRVVATSRERLAVAGEQEYVVPPLDESAATELFVMRARQVKDDFEPDEAIPQICALVDRLPLALELASTRVKLLSTHQILERLDRRLPLLAGGRRDLPARQSTMRATIDWSYDLLTAEEQRVFRALSVFAGNFEIEAAERVCDATLDSLQSLVDKSLLRRSHHGRFFLLETTLEYARERLDDAGEGAALRERHARWFLDLARDSATALHTAAQAAGLERLRADADNFRAVLAWSLEVDVAQGVDLAATLFRPWQMRGHLAELARWYEAALGKAASMQPATRVRALDRYGHALLYLERYAAAEEVLTECLALSRSLGDDAAEATAMNSLASVVSARGDLDRARSLHEAALAIYRRLDDRAGISRSLHLLGECLRDLGDFDRARAALEAAAATDAEQGDRDAAMASLHSLGDLALDVGEPAEARRRYLQALEISSGLDDERSQAYCIAGLACVAALERRTTAAGRLWAVAEATEERISLRILVWERARYERVLAPFLDDEAFRSGAAAGRCVPLGVVVAEALTDRQG